MNSLEIEIDLVSRARREVGWMLGRTPYAEVDEALAEAYMALNQAERLLMDRRNSQTATEQHGG